MDESEETEEIKTTPLYPYLLQEKQSLPDCKPISVGRTGDARYTSLPHPTVPRPTEMYSLIRNFVIPFYVLQYPVTL